MAGAAVVLLQSVTAVIEVNQLRLRDLSHCSDFKISHCMLESRTDETE